MYAVFWLKRFSRAAEIWSMINICSNVGAFHQHNTKSTPSVPALSVSSLYSICTGTTTLHGVVDKVLIQKLRKALANHSDAADAKAMQAYMKSEMPSYGVKAKAMRAILKDSIGEKKLEWKDARDTARVLWDSATHREERHVAIELTGIAHPKKSLTPAALPLFEHMIRSGAWWDYVDVIATHRIRDILDDDAETVTPVIRSWAKDNDVWIRRAAIICQLLRKRDVDQELLTYCIEANLERSEFWLRKAIGWMLRHYGRTNPDWVIAFVDEHVDRLSPLSKKEALKHL